MTRTTRPVALARNGMVSTPHYLASAAGLQVLQEGGTAVDAAIAINATLGVVYPHMTGPGGDAFWLIHDASTGRVHALNGSGRSGAQASRGYFRQRGHDAIPVRGPLASVTVPGAVDSWCAAHERFGSLPLSQLLRSAITYAREGFAVCDSYATCAAEVAEVLSAHPLTRSTLLPQDRAPIMADVLALPRLADTLQTVADKGRAGFYEGAVAEEIATSLREAGGLLTAEDLAAHHSEWTEPISTTYRGYRCYQHPPNSQGFAHLIALNILENFDLSGMTDDSPEYVHLLVEATRLAFADRDRHLTDPAFHDIPLDDLLSKEHAAELSRRISADPAPAVPSARMGGDTTCSVVVDSAGNAASVIQSLYHEFGSGFIAGETGVLLHNRGSFFSLDEAHPNRLEPGKRTFHTLMPGMLFRGDELDLVYGTMGGEGQPQTSNALVTRVVDFGRDVQSAIDAPRWLYGRTWGDERRDLRMENRFPAETLDRLRTRGHPVREVPSWDGVMGHAQAIRVTDDVLMGGADPRGDGLALGW
ncbi:gamma-glutamyltransferase [Streptomyces sp. SCSIO 75703]|uniref:gamma-glutamyltransferase n=1 Tax=unclassified Streptomyces TaxID=2593676 RepID=UPI000562EF5A|nr:MULTISPECIES: gamma-glutamyltransferase [unclassified Streptomyces]